SASSSRGVIAWPASSSWARSASQSRASTLSMPLQRRGARICVAILEGLQLGQAEQVGGLVEPHRGLVGAQHLLHRAGGGEQRRHRAQDEAAPQLAEAGERERRSEPAV